MAEETKKGDKDEKKGGEKKAPKSTASSESQRKLAGLALAVKKGRVDDAEVTSNVRDMAADMSTSDLRAMASKPGGKKKLPDKVTPEKKKESMKEDTTYKGIPGTFDYSKATPAEIDAAEKRLAKQKMDPGHPSYGDEYGGERPATDRAEFDSEFDADESVASGFGDDPGEHADAPSSDFYSTEEPVEAPHDLNFYDIVGKYNEYGQMLRRDRSMTELAQQLSDIAEAAEMHLTSEANDWYDSHTISRNIKEMQGYAKEFGKLAQEADEYNIRMEALYEDMGRVLERYFEIYPQDEAAQQNSPQPQMHQVNPLAVTQKEFPHERQAKSVLNPHIEEAVSARAVIIARSKLRKEDVEKFDSLPIVRKVLAAWKILSENSNG